MEPGRWVDRGSSGRLETPMKRCLLSRCALTLFACQTTVADERPTPDDRISTVAIDMEQVTTIKPGLNHLYFEGWGEIRLPVWVYVPTSVEAREAPVLFMMHGAKRGAARYLSEWDQIAERQGFIVVAPEFTRNAFPGSAGYNLGNRIPRGVETVIEEAAWTFSAIEPLFDYVVERLGGSQTDYTIYGHSAGSQFTHRFMYFKPEARAKRFLAANAGWYTFPDLEVDYPVGLGGLGLSDHDLKRYLEKDLVILIGDQDNDPTHESLKRDDGVDQQGPHRFARGQNFFEKGRAEAERVGAQFGWQLRIVEGVAHSNGGMAAAAADLVE